MSPKKPASNTETAVRKAGARVAATVANANAVMPKAEPSETEPTPPPARVGGAKAKKAADPPTVHDSTPTTPSGDADGLTLADLAERYLKHLESTGKSRGTVFSYSLDLGVASKYFGKDTDATTITRDEVAAYFESDAVQKNKGGAPKNPITTAKLRRTVRQMFAFAEETGIVATSPVPPLEKKAAKQVASAETTPAEVDDGEPLVITRDPAAQAALGTLKNAKRGRKPKSTASAAHETPVAATSA